MMEIAVVAGWVGVALGLWLALAPSESVHLPQAATPVEPSSGARGRNPLWPALAALGKIVPRSRKQRDDLGATLLTVESPLSAEEFGGLQLVAACWGALLVFLLRLEFRSLPPIALVPAALVGMVMPQLWLNARLRKRHRAMLALLPEVVDLLALCMGAGLDFLSALKRVAAIKEFQRHPLMEELAGTLQEIRVGKRRSDALRAMARRVNLPELTSFVRTLVQADRMGTPLNEVLAIHSEDVRFQRFMRAERAALKAPIKILLPLIFFILPCVALVVGAPIFIQFSKQNPFGR